LEDTSGVFSFVWGSAGPGESTVTLLDSVTSCKNLFEFHDSLQEKAGESWISLGINIVASDIEGNIGYWMLSASPIRKNDYPYLGSRVLDGTSTVHDWEGIASIKDMPYYINPDSGYFHTSNARNVPENSKYEYGAGVTNSIRNLRIDEILSQGIAKGHKFDL
jgi:acyl-homoserine lactone acylase PvdQ